MNSIKKLWEERSKEYRRDVRGVLPKSFPSWLNKILHRWMWGQVKTKISKVKTKRVLDVGCGYGRIAKEVITDFRKTKVYGIDISKTYVDFFNKDLSPSGHARVGDIRKLPFKSDSFDLVYMVTTLMYLPDKKDQIKAMAEIFRVLKPGGKFIFIERNPTGQSLFTLGGIITSIRGRKHKEIESVSFSSSKMSRLIRMGGGFMEEKTGFPFGKLLTPSLYISYSGVKK